MGSNLVLLLLFISGCSTLSPDEKQAYEQGYRSAAKEEMRTIAAEFQGGRFPYYHWESPIVQSVQVPGHISNGVFIPAHKELVIIKPGEWAQAPAYPISASKEEYEGTDQMDVRTADITHLPGGHGEPAGPGRAGESSDITAGVGGAK